MAKQSWLKKAPPRLDENAFVDWYCTNCRQWLIEQEDGAHQYHNITVSDRTHELVSAAQRWHATRKLERELAKQVYDLILRAHEMGVPETRIAELAGVDRMTVRRALGKR